MKIALGSDHRGAETVAALVAHLKRQGHETSTVGPLSGEPGDYPDSAYAVSWAVAGAEADLGILVCGSGIGMSIAANKIPGIRAGLSVDEHAARMMRRHNNANVLCLAGDRTTPEQACSIVDAFLAADFEGGRHRHRVSKITAIEQGDDPREQATERRDEGVGGRAV